MLGKRTKVKVAKNKVAPPFKVAEFDIVFGEGISKVGEVLDLAVELDIVKKSGSWFSYDELRLGQGREKVKDFLKENQDTLRDIESKVREHHGLKSVEEMEKAYEEYRGSQVIVPMEAKGKGKRKAKAADKQSDDESSSED
jgi:recombination protein RecA